MTPDMPVEQPENPRQPYLEAEPLRIMLLGKSGSGKSSSGNTLLGKEAFKSDMKLARVTHFCEREAGNIDNKPVAVIDTPGLFETRRNEELIIKEILKSSTLYKPGPHVFVVVIPLGRLTQEDEETNTLIEKKFGSHVWHYTIVLFTHGDRLEGKTINDIITESDETLRNFLRKCSGGFHVFNNKDPQDQKQVTSFLAKLDTLVALNGGGHYKNDLFPPEEQKIRIKQESILAERHNEILQAEIKLRDRFQGEELDTEKNKLWRKEEDSARKQAENALKSKWKVLLLVVVLFGVVILAVTTFACAVLQTGCTVVVLLLGGSCFINRACIISRIQRIFR